MAVLRVKDINGNWVSIPVIATGDAKTLGGHPANHFVFVDELASWINNDYTVKISNITNRVTTLETQMGTIATTLDEINGTEV